MKRNLLSALGALLITIAFSSTAVAQTKVAIIDLKKVFDGYYKTKQADTQLKERAGDFDKARRGLIDDYQKANDEYKKVAEAANDPALGGDERSKKKADAEKKLNEIKELETSIRQFDGQSKQTLAEQQRRMRDNVLRDIRDVISEISKASSYSLVMDTAAESINQVPIILFNNGENDISDAVLVKLNANMPADALKPKEEKKDDKK
jgi:outer membrane protein